MAPAKKHKEKSNRKAKVKSNTKRTVRKVDRQTNQKLKMNWVLSAETWKKKQNKERVKAWRERKKAEEQSSKNKKK